ncbi:MAG: hypothetical protein ACI8RZ_003427 [Myxococcota bacterium]|jgi:hypothetical protein
MLSSLLILSQAFAQDSTTVLVAPFEPLNDSASGLVAMMPDFLGQQLAASSDFKVLSLAEIGTIYDTPAEVYASSCTPGEFVGCAFVLAEAGEARFAITGTIEAHERGSRIDVRIVDVDNAREAVGFVVDVAMGDDAILADAVSAVLAAVQRGDIGQESDARGEGVVEAPLGPNKDEAATDLNRLNEEIGGIDTLDTREEGILTQEDYSREDLFSDMEAEGTKPWERLEMTPREYLRYKNSGRPLYEWRALSEGRQGQVLLRASLGYGRGPVQGDYYGRIALADETLQVAETYAWQSMATAAGVSVAGSVGYGLLPELEVGLTGGLVTGRFNIDIDRITEGDFSTSSDLVDYGNTTLFIGPQALYVLLPTSQIRPVIGGSAVLWRGTGVDSHIIPSAELPGGGVLEALPVPYALSVNAIGGVEVTMSDALDLWLHVPVGAVIATWNAPSIYHEGSGILEEEGMVTDPTQPGSAAAGIHIGIQVRAWEREKKRTLSDYEEL